MKRATAKRTRHPRLPGHDEGLVIEMLRLTPTERLLKAWRYSEFALEMQRATGLRPRNSKS